MFTAIKRTIIIGAIFLGIGYLGDSCSVRNVLHSPFTAAAVVEQGYAQPEEVSIVATKNEDGTYHTTLSYNNLTIPLFERKNGPQLGSAEYLWKNLDDKEKQSIGTLGWYALDNRLELVQEELNSYENLEHVLNEEQSQNVFSSYWTNLPEAEQASIITNTLPTLNVGLRSAVALQEIATLLGAGYQQTSEQNNMEDDAK